MPNMIKINNTLINPDHITHIELDAKVYDYETSQYRPGVIIHLAVTEGEIGMFTDTTDSLNPYPLEFRDEAAEVLRPWLNGIFFLDQENGQRITLPEPVKLKFDAPGQAKE